MIEWRTMPRRRKPGAVARRTFTVAGRKLPAWAVGLALVLVAMGAAAGPVLAGRVLGTISSTVSQALLIDLPTVRASSDAGLATISDDATRFTASNQMNTGDQFVVDLPLRNESNAPLWGQFDVESPAGITVSMREKDPFVVSKGLTAEATLGAAYTAVFGAVDLNGDGGSSGLAVAAAFYESVYCALLGFPLDLDLDTVPCTSIPVVGVLAEGPLYPPLFLPVDLDGDFDFADPAVPAGFYEAVYGVDLDLNGSSSDSFLPPITLDEPVTVDLVGLAPATLSEQLVTNVVQVGPATWKFPSAADHAGRVEYTVEVEIVGPNLEVRRLNVVPASDIEPLTWRIRGAPLDGFAALAHLAFTGNTVELHHNADSGHTAIAVVSFSGEELEFVSPAPSDGGALFTVVVRANHGLNVRVAHADDAPPGFYRLDGTLKQVAQ